MSIAVKTDARVKSVAVTDELITFHLKDGRVVGVPLAWSWRLKVKPIHLNDRITKSSAMDRECIGLTSTKTSASKGCSPVFPLGARSSNAECTASRRPAV